jgi:hypothetical protein
MHGALFCNNDPGDSKSLEREREKKEMFYTSQGMCIDETILLARIAKNSSFDYM